MSNCNKLFRDFCNVITPSFDQMQQMKKSRKALEKKIAAKIMDKLGLAVSFYTQGSGAKHMRTIIIKENGTYDADRGIYLPEKPNVGAETVQRYVYDAVNDHTADGAEHRRKCIRVFYKSAYNIDFPVYYQLDDESYAHLAIKGNDWIKDDPYHMITWFDARKDTNGQLIRVVKYLKAWASKCNCKMPSGIALAVWAAKNFSAVNDRDDECLLKLLKAIKSAVTYSVTCYSPVEPFDDLTSKLSFDQKERFKLELDNFCSDAQKAIDETNQLRASKMWRKYLGYRFPEGLDEDTEARANSLLASANVILSHSAQLGRTGNIGSTGGVAHQTHRNYGG